jgi:signal peptidase I
MARKRNITAGVLAVAMVGLLWLFFAPVQLGGPIVYTSTVGNSMEPRFHKGDLALVRSASSYAVGDVVLYESPVLHRAVLHRILRVENGHYYFKGDHNDFVDPGYATRADLLGKLWLRVPRAGKGLSWVAKPSHAALVTAAAALFFLLGAFRGKSRRQRGTRETARRAGLVVRLRRGMHKPRRTPAFFVGVAAVLLGLILVPVSFLSPLRKTVPRTGAFQSNGTFTYSAAARPSASYPDGVVHTGQPLYLALVKEATLSFAYRFQSGLPHRVRGTIALRARISSDAWHHTYTIHGLQRFAGDGGAVHATVDPHALVTLARQLSIESGLVGGSYDVVIEPVVHVTGLVAGKAVDSFFAPQLPFTLSQSVLTPNAPQAPTLPGAEYQAASTTSALDAALHPVQAGSIPAFGPNHVTLARYALPVSSGRGLGLGLLAIGLLLCLSGQFHRRRDVWSSEQRIAFRYECVIVEVGSLPVAEGVVEMADFEQLATLAQHGARPILREARSTGDLYAVEDGTRRYVYRAAAALVPAESGPVLQPTQPLPPRRRRPAALGSLPFRAAGLVVVIGITVAAATAFTAGNTVPATLAGSSQQPKSTATLVPASCSSLAITTLKTGSGTITVSTSHTLVLGSSGNDSITDNGDYNCFVGGGGKDNVSGKTHSVCIVNGDPRSSYTGCTKSS